MNNKKVNLHQANRRHLINLQYFVYFGKEGICVTLFTIRVCYMTRFCSIIICPYRAFWITHVFLFHVYIACIICHISLCVTGTFNLLPCNLLSITWFYTLHSYIWIIHYTQPVGMVHTTWQVTLMFYLFVSIFIVDLLSVAYMIRYTYYINYPIINMVALTLCELAKHCTNQAVWRER